MLVPFVGFFCSGRSQRHEANSIAAAMALGQLQPSHRAVLPKIPSQPKSNGSSSLAALTPTRPDPGPPEALASRTLLDFLAWPTQPSLWLALRHPWGHASQSAAEIVTFFLRPRRVRRALEFGEPSAAPSLSAPVHRRWPTLAVKAKGWDQRAAATGLEVGRRAAQRNQEASRRKPLHGESEPRQPHSLAAAVAAASGRVAGEAVPVGSRLRASFELDIVRSLTDPSFFKTYRFIMARYIEDALKHDRRFCDALDAHRYLDIQPTTSESHNEEVDQLVADQGFASSPPFLRRLNGSIWTATPSRKIRRSCLAAPTGRLCCSMHYP
ncbi:uncharacterized protein PAN0_020d5946 [Moesziomyces antarcticus]|uniref:Uncharacterized protein n=1 Tax=Pseudozyma antarctica TaxID=84753 RepID=A0A081CM21_PSEA2|nr:uncharacterized protein PAN0_020d5946 [Moesziomyces antarcticus]GAK67717.1 hypothetical protein PAN0_020d5946 [Moesziomyces antarcticus]